jgi:hypothetical protein
METTLNWEQLVVNTSEFVHSPLLVSYFSLFLFDVFLKFVQLQMQETLTSSELYQKLKLVEIKWKNCIKNLTIS